MALAIVKGGGITAPAPKRPVGFVVAAIFVPPVNRPKLTDP